MRSILPYLGLGALLAGTTFAMAAVKPDDAIRYRQAAYTMIGWNFGPMAQMVKGKTPWNASEFSMHAERVAALATQLLEGFPPGSDSGARTSAKAEIWKNNDDFKLKLNDFIQQSQRLVEVAKGGDEAKAKEQFKTTAGTCKACHDKYRSQD